MSGQGRAGPGSVAFVLGTSAGGTGPHVAMLAEGCLAGGIAVSVHGPAETLNRFFGPAGRAGSGDASPPGSPGPRLVPAEIAAGPRPARDLAAVLRLRRLLRAAGPDLVHAHGLRAGALTALALTGRRHERRVPLLVTVHNAPPAPMAASAVYQMLERIVAHRAACVACVSADLAERMRSRGAASTELAVVPAPARRQPTAAEVAAARRELAGPGGAPVVLAVGRLAAQKGFPVLLEAAARWRNRTVAPVVAIAGAGPLEAELRSRAAALRLDARFLGHRHDVPALIAAADVLVVPSTWEGQPLIVAEALAAGAAVVASRTGGIPAMTGEDGAYLVPPGDAAALALGVTEVLDKPGLAATLSAVARERAASLPGRQQAVGAALGLYLRLTGEGASPAHAGADGRGGG